MSCSKNGVGVEQDTTTEVRAAVGQADNVGEFTKSSGGSSDNIWSSSESGSTVFELSSGWKSSRQRKDGHRKSEREVENWCHCEGAVVQSRTVLEGYWRSRSGLELLMRLKMW